MIPLGGAHKGPLHLCRLQEGILGSSGPTRRKTPGFAPSFVDEDRVGIIAAFSPLLLLQCFSFADCCDLKPPLKLLDSTGSDDVEW